MPENFAKGELVSDTAMDLETNANLGLARENSLLLQKGKVSRSATVKMAQTFRSGTNDIDALYFVELFLDDEDQTNLDHVNDVYVLVNFRPAITNRNWRMDCGVAGYDNTRRAAAVLSDPAPLRGLHLPAVDPATRHRRRARGRRADAHQEQLHAAPARVRGLQRGGREPAQAEDQGELRAVDDLGIEFDYDGEVTAQDSEQILDRITAIHRARARRPRATRQRGAAARAGAIRVQPGEGLLRLRGRLLPAEPQPDRGRRDRRHPGRTRAVADARRDLLLPQAEPRAAADASGEPAGADARGGERPPVQEDRD